MSWIHVVCRGTRRLAPTRLSCDEFSEILEALDFSRRRETKAFRSNQPHPAAGILVYTATTTHLEVLSQKMVQLVLTKDLEVGQAPKTPVP